MEQIVLNKIELDSLGLRTQIIIQKEAELQILKREKEYYQIELLNKYKLDLSKKYGIDSNGIITEVKDDEKPIMEMT